MVNDSGKGGGGCGARWVKVVEGDAVEGGGERLIDHLSVDADGTLLPRLNRQSAMAVLEPWFGFGQQVSREGMAALLRG